MSDEPYTVDPLIFENTFNYTIARFSSIFLHNDSLKMSLVAPEKQMDKS